MTTLCIKAARKEQVDSLMGIETSYIIENLSVEDSRFLDMAVLD
ncbi:MAG: hypothetical protein WAM14_02155 [Candidatus Nitrosopolaris sp.]